MFTPNSQPIPVHSRSIFLIWSGMIGNKLHPLVAQHAHSHSISARPPINPAVCLSISLSQNSVLLHNIPSFLDINSSNFARTFFMTQRCVSDLFFLSAILLPEINFPLNVFIAIEDHVIYKKRLLLIWWTKFYRQAETHGWIKKFWIWLHMTLNIWQIFT